MFDHMLRLGLMDRIRKKFFLPEDEWVVVTYPIGTACYPKAVKPGEDGIFEPIIPVWQIRALTDRCVNDGVGTLDDLYRMIWGMGFKEYITTLVGLDEDQSGRY